MFGLFSKKKKRKKKKQAAKPITGLAASKTGAKKITAKKQGTTAKKRADANASELSYPDHLSDQRLIHEAVGAAKAEVSADIPESRKPPVRQDRGLRTPMTEREKIIQQALAVQRTKSSLLNDLDPKMRAKVQKLAIELMSRPNHKPDA